MLRVATTLLLGVAVAISVAWWAGSGSSDAAIEIDGPTTHTNGRFTNQVLNHSPSLGGTVRTNLGTTIAGVRIGLEGVTEDGRRVKAYTTTAEDGTYVFSGLGSGTYSLSQVQPRLYSNDTEVVGSVGGTATERNQIDGIVLAANSSGVGYDFVEASGSIAGKVSDNGRRGIEAVVVTLIGTDDGGTTYNRSTRTGLDGEYRFDDLPSGLYKLAESQPGAYGDGSENAGSAGGEDSANDTISGIFLAPGEHSTGNNFRERTGSLSGAVFEDRDNDGQPDSDEPVIADVSIVLTGVDDLGNVVDITTTTGADGAYRFGDLLAGTYTLSQVHPERFLDGQDAAGSAGGNIGLVDDEISGIVLAGGQDAVGYNFGELDIPLIAGAVYEDRNNNGVRDPAEFGIAGVEIKLTGVDFFGRQVTGTTLTNASGEYVFGSLLTGTYSVTEIQPSNYTDGFDTVGSEGGVVSSADDTISSIKISDFSGGFGYDFGELVPATISGLVSDDFDDPISDVTVTLTGANDRGEQVTETVVTDTNGTYKFSGLRPGTYSVTEIQPWAFGEGGAAVGTVGAFQDGPNIIGGIAVGPHDVATENNFFERTGSLAGSVFKDSDHDGDRDTGEEGIAGVTLTLVGQDAARGSVVRRAVTNDEGDYIFQGLGAGRYEIFEAQPDGFVDGLEAVGTEGGFVRRNGDRISGIAIDGGDHGRNYNFGEILLSSISGLVFEDLNHNAARDGDERGIAGVHIQLTGVDDRGQRVERNATTGHTGWYRFEDLRPGTYAVTETQPDNYLDGAEGIGAFGGLTDPRGDTIATISLSADAHAGGYDFGELLPSSIAGVVTDETGQPLAIVPMYIVGFDDNGDRLSQSIETSDDGSYRFDRLRPGTYDVSQLVPFGYGDGIGIAGSTGGDGGVSNITGIELPASTDSVGNNFEQTMGTLAGSVFADRNNNGQRDRDELGLSSLRVELTGINSLGQTVSLTTTTASDGSYLFEHLLAGRYTVSAAQPVGYVDGVDAVGSAGGFVGRQSDDISRVVLAGGETATGYHFGEIIVSSISGFVFDDDDHDGAHQAGDKGVSGVMVSLEGKDDLGRSVSALTVTDAVGRYSFGDLRPGTYTLIEEQPDGYLDGLESVGTSGGSAPDNEESSPHRWPSRRAYSDTIKTISLAPFTDATGYNFAELQPSTVEGVVTNDAGVRLDNVLVALSGTNDRNVDVKLTATTSTDGSYSFADLRPGQYSLSIAQAVGYPTAASPASVGTPTPETGSNGQANDAKQSIGSLGAGMSAVANPFVLATGSISGSVYVDSNNNGVHDGGEDGLSATTVRLSGTNDRGVPIEQTAATDEAGRYTFDRLVAGRYTIEAEQDPHLLDGLESVGSAGGYSTGLDRIRAIHLEPGRHATGYTFGEVIPSSISGNVTDDSGKPIGNTAVTVAGRDDHGRWIWKTQVTTSDGGYKFEGLRPGTYTVSEEQPVGYGDGQEHVGSAGGSRIDDIISEIVLTPGTDSNGNNFDEQTGSLSGSVFEDMDNNGIRDPGEPGVAGVDLKLSGRDHLGNLSVEVATTDGGGRYVFEHLLAGVYTVSEIQPDTHLDGIDRAGSHGGYSQSGSRSGSGSGRGSDSDEISGIALGAGVVAEEYNFAELLPLSINGAAENLDGSAVAGAGIVLGGIDDRGNAIDRLVVATGADGSFRFSGLRPGTYSIEGLGRSDSSEIRRLATLNGASTFVDGVISEIVLVAGVDADNVRLGLPPTDRPE